jgi:hypothetical protein
MAGWIPGMSDPLPLAGLVVLAGRRWPAGRSLVTSGLDDVGSLTSHVHIGLHSLLRKQLYFFTFDFSFSFFWYTLVHFLANTFYSFYSGCVIRYFLLG